MCKEKNRGQNDLAAGKYPAIIKEGKVRSPAISVRSPAIFPEEIKSRGGFPAAVAPRLWQFRPRFITMEFGYSISCSYRIKHVGVEV